MLDLGQSRRVSFPVPATILAVLALGVAPVAAWADGEIVNRAPGLTGAPFGGNLVDVSESGRYVLLSGPGDLAGLPAASSTAYLRDRTAGTLSAVLRETGADGAVHPSSASEAGLPAEWSPVSVSPDGRRVLIRTGYWGTPTARLLVRDLDAGTTTVVSTLPGGGEAESAYGLFVDGGAAVLFTAIDAAGKPGIYRRAAAGGPVTLLKAGASLSSATRDGSTFTWSRALTPVTAPSTMVPPVTEPVGGSAVGYTTVGGASRIVDRSNLVVRANDAPYPYCGFLQREGTSPNSLQIDEAGQHLWWTRSTTFASNPNTTSAYFERDSQNTATGAAGQRYITGGGGQPFASPSSLSATGDFYLFTRPTGRFSPISFTEVAQAAGSEGWTPPSRGDTPAPLSTDAIKLFAQDRGYVSTEQTFGSPESPGERNVVAFDPTGPVPAAPPVIAPKPGADELADDAALTPNVTFTPCEKPTAAAAINLTLASPVTTSKPAGTVGRFQSANSAPSKATITVKTLGFTTWTKTLKQAQLAEPTTLPRPYWLLPQTVTVTVSYEASGSIPATSISTTRGWTALR